MNIIYNIWSEIFSSSRIDCRVAKSVSIGLLLGNSLKWTKLLDFLCWERLISKTSRRQDIGRRDQNRSGAIIRMTRSIGFRGPSLSFLRSFEDRPVAKLGI